MARSLETLQKQYNTSAKAASFGPGRGPGRGPGGGRMNATNTVVKPVIKDLKWGIETMKYMNGSHTLDIILNQENQIIPKPGDILIIKNASDVHQGEYQE